MWRDVQGLQAGIRDNTQECKRVTIFFREMGIISIVASRKCDHPIRHTWRYRRLKCGNLRSKSGQCGWQCSTCGVHCDTDCLRLFASLCRMSDIHLLSKTFEVCGLIILVCLEQLSVLSTKLLAHGVWRKLHWLVISDHFIICHSMVSTKGFLIRYTT